MALEPDPSIDAPGVNEFGAFVKPVSLWLDAWRRLRKNRLAVVGLFVVSLYIIVAAAAPLLPIYPYEEQVIDHQNLPPSFLPAGQVLVAEKLKSLEEKAKEEERELGEEERAELAALKDSVAAGPEHARIYLLGTDSLGRDMLSRVIHGGRISIMIGLVGTITAMLIGILIGSIAGYLGGRIDNFLMRFVDIMYGLPYMLIVIILMAVFGRNILILFVAIALVSWLTISRVVRGQIISLKQSEFVEAARSMGAGAPRIIFRHLLPNTLGVIVIFSTLEIPRFILSESFLSFLGLGVSAPLASWGSLVADGVQGMELYPWQLLGPAVCMTIFLFAMNFLGDGLRDAFDPQSKNRL
jgi:oligopeptide transport system permease protein